MIKLNDGRNELWQWDTGRSLNISEQCDVVHFSNLIYGNAITVSVIDGVAKIPDELLQTGADLICWCFVGDPENGYTKLTKTFEVNKKPKPNDYVFTPTDQITIKDLIRRVEDAEEYVSPESINTRIDDALQEAKESGDFKGEKGDKGDKGDPGDTGQDYVLTDADKADIAEEVAKLVTTGTSIDVTAEVGQTIVVKSVDENGKPTAWESADYQERTHWTFSGGGLVLDGQTVTFGSDGMGAISGTLDIEAGKTYTVIWDGAEYICDCKTGYYSGMAVVYIGNPVFLGLDNNGLPFVIGKVLANGYTMAACLQPNTTHSVGIISATVNKIPERYMGDNEFVLHFEGEPNNEGELTVKETAQEILAAIKAGKKFVCEHYSMYMGMESKSKSSACGVFTILSDEGTLFDVLCGPANFGVSSVVDTVSVIAVEIMENAQGLVEYMRIMATRYYNDKIIYHDEKSST